MLRAFPGDSPGRRHENPVIDYRRSNPQHNKADVAQEKLGQERTEKEIPKYEWRLTFRTFGNDWVSFYLVLPVNVVNESFKKC